MTRIYAPYLTCSAIDRWRACPGSAHLARVRTQSAAADAGTDRHEEMLHPDRCPSEISRWFGAMPKFEEAFGLDAETGTSRFFGAFQERHYPCEGPIWLAGSSDARHCTGDCISVGDLKTGMLQVGGALGEPKNSGQLLGLAYLLLVYGQSVRPDWRPSRVRLAWFKAKGTKIDTEDGEITVDELREWGHGLRAAMMAANTALVPTLSSGSQCDHCPSFDTCPTGGGAIRRVLSLETVDGLDPERLIEAFSTAKLAERACESALRAIATRLRREGDAEGERQILRLRTGSTRRIEPGTAYKVLTGYLKKAGHPDAEDRALACLSYTVTQRSIATALGEDAVPEVMDALEQGGAVTRVDTTPFPTLVKRR